MRLVETKRLIEIRDSFRLEIKRIKKDYGIRGMD